MKSVLAIISGLLGVAELVLRRLERGDIEEGARAKAALAQVKVTRELLDYASKLDKSWSDLSADARRRVSDAAKRQ